MAIRWAVRGLYLLTGDIERHSYYGKPYSFYKVISPSEWAGDKIDGANDYCPELNNKFNAYGWGKGLPRVRYTEFPYSVPNKCDGQKAALYDIYADGPERAATLMRLLDKYPDCKIPGYNYSALDQLAPHGEITRWFINGLECPDTGIADCGIAKPGEEIEVVIWLKNMGQSEGEFRVYIYDQDGNVLSKEPDFTYKNVKASEHWEIKKTLLSNLNFEMIDKVLNGKVKVVKQT